MLYIENEKIVPTIFPDKTSQVWKIDINDYKEENVTITWKFESEDELMHLCQLYDLLNAYGYKIKLKLPYLPYARQDKNVSNETTFAFKTFAKILNTMIFTEVEIVDPHSSLYYLIHNSKAIYPIEEVKKAFEATNSNCVVYPDSGAFLKYLNIYKDINESFEHPYSAKKIRNQLTGWIESYNVDGDFKDKNVLIVDDICDGGTTFNILSKSLIKLGAKEINLFVTHGIFSRGLDKLKENINRIFVRDFEVDSWYNNTFIKKHY